MRWCRGVSKWTAMFWCGSLFATFAHADNPDLIFSEGGEAGFVVRGKAFAAEPLANAEVEARFDGRVIRTNTDSQGNYELVVWSLIDQSATVTLTVRGSGAQASQVFQSVLGPIDETQPRAGVDGVLVRAEDPFVDLTPRTTAFSAAFREGGGGTIPGTASSYHRVARAIQVRYVRDLAVMLHLYATGAESFPADIVNTLDTVGSLTSIQRTYARFYELSNSAGACSQPSSPFCTGLALYNSDENLVPSTNSVSQSLYVSFRPWNRVSGIEGAIQFAGATADIWHFDGTKSLGIPVSEGTSAWPTRVGFPDQRPLRSFVSFPFNSTIGGQVRRIDEIYAQHYRFTRGPSGQLLAAIGESRRVRYPDHPQLPNEDYPVSPIGGSASPLLEGPPTAALNSGRPAIAGQRILLPVATAPVNQQPWLLQYDIAEFNAQGTLTFERTPVTGTWSILSDGSLQISVAQQPPVQMALKYFNEEEPGVWRLSVHAKRQGESADEIQGTGLLTVAAPRQPGFTASDFATRRWRTEINAHHCGGPLGSIENLVPTSLFPFCNPPFGWQFQADGTAFNLPGEPQTPPRRIWSMLGGANLGLIYIEGRLSNGTPNQWRAWQRVRSTGNRHLMLEDFSSAVPLPPFTIGRSSRLNELTPYPD